MDIKRYPEQVGIWFDTVSKCAGSDSQRMSENCQLLEQYARQNRCDDLLGYSFFYRGYDCYARNMLTDSLDYLSTALNHLLTAGEWEMAARTYTAMGNIADAQGDVSLATDCNFKGLTLCQEYDLARGEYNIRSNIASIFLSLGEYAHAADMLRECELLSEKVNVASDAQNVLWANLSECYLQLGELEKSAAYLKQLKETHRDEFGFMEPLMISMLEAKLYYASGDIEGCERAIADLSALEFNSTMVLSAFSELCQHAEMLLQRGNEQDFLIMLDRISEFAKTPKTESRILSLRLKHTKLRGDSRAYAEMAIRHYELNSMLSSERNKIVSHNILNRIRLEEEANRRREIEKTNLLLKQRSEHDSLTGLNNRYRLNELAENAFQRAYVDGTPLTLEILDIDCFKEYNDNYGHQAGDDCLVKIAEAIRSLEAYPGVHTARYGGDEFVIIYENHSVDSVTKLAAHLQEKVRRMNIEHKFSTVSDRVSISQGLFRRIPSGANKLWDWLSCADMALYGVKAHGKNGFHVSTDFAEVNSYYRSGR